MVLAYAPGVYQPDSTIADLVLRGGMQRAQMQQEGLSNLGNTIANIPIQQRQQQMAQQEMALKQAEANRQQTLAESQQAEMARQAAERKAMDVASAPDEGGQSKTSAQILSSLDAQGMGHLRMVYGPKLAEMDKAAADMKKSQLDLQAKTADYSANAGYNYLDAAKGPDGGLGVLGGVLLHAKNEGGLDTSKIEPQYQAAVQAYQAAMAKGDTQGAAAIAAKARETFVPIATQLTSGASQALQEERAKRTGNIPMTPYEQAQIKIKQTEAGETATHHRAEEKAAEYTATGGFGYGTEAPPGQPNVPPGLGTPPPAIRAPTAGPSAAPTGKPTGEDYLKTVPPPMVPLIKAYAEGRMPVPGGAAMRSPRMLQILTAVQQYDPTFTAADFEARANARKDFVGGGKTSDQIKSLNQVVGHLAGLSDAADKLNNYSLPIPGITAVNKVTNAIGASAGNPAPGNFNLQRQAVVSELERAWRQSGGSEQDMKAWKESLSSSETPQQLKAAIATLAHAVEAPVQALENKRDQALGKGGSDITVLSPQARDTLNRLQGNVKLPATQGPKPEKGDKGYDPQGRLVTFDGKDWVRG